MALRCRLVRFNLNQSKEYLIFYMKKKNCKYRTIHLEKKRLGLQDWCFVQEMIYDTGSSFFF